MKRSQITVGGQPITTADSGWDRIIESIKGLSAEQQLKLADNIKASALASIRTQQEKLQGELSHLSSLVVNGGPTSTEKTALPAKASTTDKVLAALRRGGGKTIKVLQAECGTPWVNMAISNLIQSRQVVSNNQRPAAYSLAR